VRVRGRVGRRCRFVGADPDTPPELVRLLAHPICGPLQVSPQGLRSAHAYWSEDGQEVVGVSLWESKDSCDAWRASEAAARRREAMAPYVVEEREAFYRGRELAMPATR
jgi:hypothetical protein